ncbi:hypothetical protein C8R31_101652 [Nitrosospira sp. Nsp2]|uniref:DUF6148 family protein n=1 Tax=Nitrosospira sp. Nsp2 TaxID=136548 RepID=UPI000D31D6E0|nr:DUF6148 family protein [Nitrosospira sp. Nsp2]PTR17488.1 hypothetical protein C8R31_101652 [Nitrosospira sp. Nsp2]
MAGITLVQAEAQLALWIDADTAVASGQEYQIAGRTLRRTDAAEISNKIDYWNKWVQRLSSGGNGGMRIRGVTPV